MVLSEVCRVLAAETGRSEGSVKMLARRLQEIDAIPKGPGGRIAPNLSRQEIARLLLAMLIDEASPLAARHAVRLSALMHEGTRADVFIGRLLEGARLAVDAASQLAFHASITVHGGEQEAVIVRITTTDDPLEMVFVADDEEYHPEFAQRIVPAFTLPGLLLHRIGRALHDLGAA